MPANLFIQAWAKDLVKNLYPENSFYRNGKDDTAFVDNDQVNLPQAGVIPTVVIDRTEKATATQRTDDVTMYNLHEFSADPCVIKWSEELIVNYAKRANITEDFVNALNTEIANFMAWSWVNNGSHVKISTSGEARAAAIEGATGSRKAVTLLDILSVRKAMNKQNVPLENRFALIDPEVESDLLQIDEVKNILYSGKTPLVKGSIGTFLGFTWYIREKANLFTAAGNLRAHDVGAVNGDDNAGSIFWQRSAVRWARGSVKPFINIDNPEWQGTIVSAACRSGGLCARKDGKGIISLVEAAAV